MQKGLSIGPGTNNAKCMPLLCGNNDMAECGGKGRKVRRLIERRWEEFKRLEVLRRVKSSSKGVTDGKIRS